MSGTSAVLTAALLFVTVGAIPMVYKLNENDKLEPDLIAVSSTVIPLPIYQVSYGIDIEPSSKGKKVVHPEGPILITASNKKNYYFKEDVPGVKGIVKDQSPPS